MTRLRMMRFLFLTLLVIGVPDVSMCREEPRIVQPMPGILPILPPEEPQHLPVIREITEKASSSPLPTIKGKATHLKPAPLETSDTPLPITLATALQLSDARPLVVAAAQASAAVAEAQLQRAQVIWVPELDISSLYLRFDGLGPDFNHGVNNPWNPDSTKVPIFQNVNYFYFGGGLYSVFPVTNAIFEPLAARQMLNSRRWDIQTAKNDALLETAQAYFKVHRARGMLAGTVDAMERAEKFVQRLEELSKDLIPGAEVDRGKVILAQFQQAVTSAREEWRIASADLTEVLRLDPRVVVVPMEHDHLPLTLVDASRSLDELIPIGLTNRPELSAQQAIVQASLVKIQQEKLRPLIPSVIITGFQTPGGMRTQFGIFGTGGGIGTANWSIRDDISCQLVWQLDGLGLGNLAKVKQRRGEQSVALTQLFHIQDQVAAQVTQAQAAAQSAALRMIQAERRLREAIITFDKNYEGLRQTKRLGNLLHQAYRPLEVAKALHLLKQSYDSYFTTVAEYNLAQFALYHALGYPAQDLAKSQQTGESIDIDTSRPAYLPDVGTGPPPATR